MSDPLVRLTFPAKPDYLLLARLALTGLARTLSIDPDTLGDLKLAVTEACGNAVRHAYEDGDGIVSVLYTVSSDRIEMIVEDEGCGLVDSDLVELDESELLEGGMGMSIIRAIVDELEITPGGDDRGTVVRMTKYLS
jgi:serine/threonine-protein kinase RsbW